jgi:virginiamycin B lyase
VTVQWKWSAAVYTQFNNDYNALGVKPVDANNTSQYLNSDHAGTPENYKSFLAAGATGGGGSNYTGGLTGTETVQPALAAAPSKYSLAYYDLPPGTIPYSLSAGSDGNMWISGAGSKKIVKMTTCGAVLAEYPVDNPGGPDWSTLGPDQNVWFINEPVNGGGNEVGKITPSGVITQYQLTPTPGGVGPITSFNGDLWFLESGLFRMARITTAGQITDYALPSHSGESPEGLAIGSDGNIWYTDPAVNEIGKFVISTGQTEAEYEITQTPNSEPLQMALANDGAVWFAEGNASHIGRITTDGVITEFAINHDAYPQQIAAGPDGALWFNEAHTTQIGRITTAGDILEIPTTEPGPLHGVAVGPDGNMWFTDDTGNQVVKVIIPH